MEYSPPAPLTCAPMYMARLSELTAVLPASGMASASFPLLVLRFLGSGFTFSSASCSLWLSHSWSSSSASSAALRFLLAALSGVAASALVLVVLAFTFAAAPLTFWGASLSTLTLTAAAVAFFRGEVRGGISASNESHQLGVVKVRSELQQIWHEIDYVGGLARAGGTGWIPVDAHDQGATARVAGPLPS